MIKLSLRASQSVSSNNLSSLMFYAFKANFVKKKKNPSLGTKCNKKFGTFLYTTRIFLFCKFLVEALRRLQEHSLVESTPAE